MRVIDPGHHFALDCLDGEIQQTLQFVKRVGEKYPGNEEPAYPGCTSQEVIRALIARTKYVNNQMPDGLNAIAIRGLRMALRAFETRAADKRGELDAFFDLVDGGCEKYIEELPTCSTCGHIACGKHRIVEPNEGDPAHCKKCDGYHPPIEECNPCKICGVQRPGEHSRGCYEVSEDGGGYG